MARDEKVRGEIQLKTKKATDNIKSLTERMKAAEKQAIRLQKQVEKLNKIKSVQNKKMAKSAKRANDIHMQRQTMSMKALQTQLPPHMRGTFASRYTAANKGLSQGKITKAEYNQRMKLISQEAKAVISKERDISRARMREMNKLHSAALREDQQRTRQANQAARLEQARQNQILKNRESFYNRSSRIEQASQRRREASQRRYAAEAIRIQRAAQKRLAASHRVADAQLGRFSQAMEEVGENSYISQRRVNEYRRQMAQLTRQFRRGEISGARFRQQVGGLTTRMRSAASHAFGLEHSLMKAEDAMIALGVAMGVIMAVKTVAERGEERQQTNIMLRTVFGAEKAAKALEFLQHEASTLGSDYVDVGNALAKFTIAMDGSGQSFENLTTMYDKLLKVGNVFGFDKENMQGVLKAFEQMASKQISSR